MPETPDNNNDEEAVLPIANQLPNLPNANEVDIQEKERQAAERKKQAGGAASQQMWAMIETPLGVLNAQEIAAAATDANLTCFILGTNDLLKETRAQFVPDRSPG